MGFLHEGHLSLVRASKKKCDKTIVSIFINPTQFAPSEDLDDYPRDLEKDKELLVKEGVDYLFLPDIEEIYPKNFQTFVNVENISKSLEGEFRPTHFRGVITVVNILFNCINPDDAFFGQKDAQQAAVIKQMVSDLKLNVEIIMCPIVRESDGLAMSSRNIYLSESERHDALVLYQSLQHANEKIIEGEKLVRNILSGMNEIIEKVDVASLDYIKIVEAGTFNRTDELLMGEEYFVLIACKIGRTRLIDNLKIKVN
jgi:pantoate--beta-alanine ligase